MNTNNNSSAPFQPNYDLLSQAKQTVRNELNLNWPSYSQLYAQFPGLQASVAKVIGDSNSTSIPQPNNSPMTADSWPSAVALQNRLNASQMHSSTDQNDLKVQLFKTQEQLKIVQQERDAWKYMYEQAIKREKVLKQMLQK